MSKLTDLTAQELERQRTTLNLIASENYASPATLEPLSSIWSTKYAEGLPGKRYYAGNEFADQLETEVQSLALRAFNATADYGVNVQVLSGSPANAMVYLTALEPGDTVMSLDLASGGHLSHLHGTSAWLKFYQHVNYGLKLKDGAMVLDEIEFTKALDEHQPKLVIIGFSAYPPAYDFAPYIRLAHEHGALVLADMAHISGLVAAGRHSSPFAPGPDGADFITTTTHKTLRGPRGALVYAKNEWIDRINQTVFPGTSGGPHLNQIAAVGQALLEVVGESSYPDDRSFHDYIDAVIENAKALEAGLIEGGIEVTAPTGTHLILAKLPDEIDSLALQQNLEKFGIITNRNAIPGDTKTAWRPTGLRLGTAALTSRGLTIEQSKQFGQLIGEIIQGTVQDADTVSRVDALTQSLYWPYKAN